MSKRDLYGMSLAGSRYDCVFEQATLGIRLSADAANRAVVSGFTNDILPIHRAAIADGDFVCAVNGLRPTSFDEAVRFIREALPPKVVSFERPPAGCEAVIAPAPKRARGPAAGYGAANGGGGGLPVVHGEYASSEEDAFDADVAAAAEAEAAEDAAAAAAGGGGGDAMACRDPEKIVSTPYGQGFIMRCVCAHGRARLF